jgi:hypothetical protein
MATTRHTRSRAPLLLALATLTLCIGACQAPGSGESIGNTGAIVVSTAVAGTSAATPTLPPFTIGAWPSNATPRARERLTIFIICLVQDPATGGASGPAGELRVHVTVRTPINHASSGTTGSDGIAIVPVTFDDAHPGLPVAVDVVTTWQGITYRGQTFFTPAPQGKSSPTPNDTGATPSPGAAASLTASPTPPPAPVASPTPMPNPTATPVPAPTATLLPVPTDTISP